MIEFKEELDFVYETTSDDPYLYKWLVLHKAVLDDDFESISFDLIDSSPTHYNSLVECFNSIIQTYEASNEYEIHLAGFSVAKMSRRYVGKPYKVCDGYYSLYSGCSSNFRKGVDSLIKTFVLNGERMYIKHPQFELRCVKLFVGECRWMILQG